MKITNLFILIILLVELALLSIFCSPVVAEEKIDQNIAPVEVPSWTFLMTDAVTINGQPAGRFVIDTGSNITWINPELATRLKLSPILEQSKVISANVQSLKIAGIDTGPQKIVVASTEKESQLIGMPIAGFIGGSTLSQFRFSIDMSMPQMLIHSGQLFEPADAKKFKLHILNKIDQHGIILGQPAVEGIINEQVKALVMLDTAQVPTIVLMPGLVKEQPQLATQQVIPDSLGVKIFSIESERHYVANVKNIHLLGDTFKLDDFVRAVAIMPTQANMLNSSDVYAIAGRPIFEKWKLTFDYEKSAVWTSPTQATSLEHRLSEGLDPDIKDASGTPLIFHLALIGDSTNLQLVIENGANLNAIDSDHNTLLHMAIMSSNPNVFDYVRSLPNSPSIKQANREGLTPLMAAVQTSRIDTIDALIEAGADLEVTDYRGSTALHTAAADADKLVIHRLIKAGSNMEAVTSNGFTPLIVAATRGRLETFQALVELGAKTSFENPNQSNLYHFAANGGNIQIVKLVPKLSPHSDIDAVAGGFTPLMIAADNRDIESFNALLDLGANPMIEGARGSRAIHIAAQAGDQKVIDRLLTAGIDIDTITKDGITPLMLAAARGHFDLVMKMVELGADPWQKDHQDRSAAFLAHKAGHKQLAQRLIEIMRESN